MTFHPILAALLMGGLAMAQMTYTIAPKGTVVFTANVPVVWAASFGSISQTGVYRAPAANKNTLVTIRATSGAVVGTATVQIRRR